MNNQINTKSVFSVLISILLLNTITDCQTPGPANKNSPDSLILSEIIKQVISTYPSVKAAAEAINNANARIELAKTGYYPTADLTASYANIGPVTKLTIPDLGTFQLYPNNNYSAQVNVNQNIYDFGRTRQNIKLENENLDISKQTLEQVKQKMSLLAVNLFYSIGYLQAAISIKDEQVVALNEHLAYVEKMQKTGSATEYQVLVTKVRISNVESQKVDLEAALITQRSALNSLLGNDQSAVPVVKTELKVDMPQIASDSLLSFAYHNRDEILLNEKRTSLAGLRCDLIKSQNKPVLNFQASGGAKNGYIPDLQKIMPNYVVGLGLRVPIFDGLKTKYNLAQAKSAITSLEYDSETTKRNVSNELAEANANLNADEKKIVQFRLQLEQALRAYSLAETSFKAGTITNLDLLDANTNVSESRLMLLKARIDYAASVYKLKAALGERIY